VVYPQAEHARLAASLAAMWGNEDVPRPPLPFEAFVRGVALHDRGYGELDDDPIGPATPTERWLEIQRLGFAPCGEEPVVDVVVATHVRRLVSWSAAPAAQAVLQEMTAALPAIRAVAGVAEQEAETADAVTNLCDTVAFDFCFEQPASGAVGELRYEVDGEGGIVLDPWPLAVPRLTVPLFAYRADGYPQRLEPVVQLAEVEPSARAK
jgi:hypothetical protein